MGRPNTDVRWDQKTIIYVDELEYQVSIKNAQLEDAKTEIKSLKEQLEKKNIILTNSRAGNNSLEFENKLLKQQLEKERGALIKRWDGLTEFADEYIKHPIKDTNLDAEKIQQLEQRVKRYHGAIVKFTSVLTQNQSKDEWTHNNIG
jgi:septal ring factor EnvC (AmiA/AmiB activator)